MRQMPSTGEWTRTHGRTPMIFAGVSDPDANDSDPIAIITGYADDRAGNANLMMAAPLLRNALELVVSYLAEAHAADKSADHYGDGPEDCTYCQAIQQAHEALLLADTGDTSFPDPHDCPQRGEDSDGCDDCEKEPVCALILQGDDPNALSNLSPKHQQEPVQMERCSCCDEQYPIDTFHACDESLLPREG